MKAPPSRRRAVPAAAGLASAAPGTAAALPPARLGNRATQQWLLRAPPAAAGQGAAERAQRLEREADALAQRVPLPQGGAAAATAADGSGAAPLPPAARQHFERHLGHDLSGVRLHTGAPAARMSAALGAEAFTHGRDVYFGAGRYQAGSLASHRLLGHELAHVGQQARQGTAVQAKLSITGDKALQDRTAALLNGGLGAFYSLTIGATGEVAMAPVRAAHTSSITGPSSTQKALADRLWKVTSDPGLVAMTVSANSTATVGGSYATGDFDIADLEAYGVPGLIHEIEEQYQKQIKGKGFGGDNTGAHAEALAAESEVRGAKRGAQQLVSKSVNADGTLNIVMDIPHTFPDGTVKTMRMKVEHNDIVQVTWT